MKSGHRFQSDSSGESARPIVSLRPLVHADVGSSYLGWLSDNCVNEYLSAGSENVSMEDLHAYLEDSLTSGRTNFAITLKDSGLHIGNASIYELDVSKGTFRMGWFIGNRDFWGASRAAGDSPNFKQRVRDSAA